MTERCKEERIAHSLFFIFSDVGMRVLLIFIATHLLDFL